MMMNYHEMTMNEPRDSPARRRQYLIICTIMAAVMAHALIQAGALVGVSVETDGSFPGGSLVYKFTTRDYAASNSLKESIQKDLGLKSNAETVDMLYGLYLDDPNELSGRAQRFAYGLLTDSGSSDEAKTLMALNDERTPATAVELEDLGAAFLWPKLTFEQTKLPATSALVATFPYTNGFVSAMMLGLKVIPALRKAAAAEGADPIVVVSTCSVKQSTCTHYVPLKQGKPFLLGRVDYETHVIEVGPQPALIDWDGVKKGLRKLRGYLDYFGWFKEGSTETAAKEEL
jgi:hypothetical protein